MQCYVSGAAVLHLCCSFPTHFYMWDVKMSCGVQPCFQLLRIGLSNSNSSNGSESADPVRDLYTFRPALAQCVFRLGRAPELCDVTLESVIVSRIHAELHVERETDASGEEGWKVLVKDRSSYGGFTINIYVRNIHTIDYYYYYYYTRPF